MGASPAVAVRTRKDMMDGGGSLGVANESGSGDEQVITMRGLLRDLRRFLKLIVALALAGLVIGVAYTVAVPALPAATSLVLLPASGTNAEGQPIQDPQTDVEIALSPAVLVPAGREAGLALSYPTLHRRVAVTTPTTNIVQIAASASTSRDAEELANAVARQFVRYLNNSSVVAANTVVALEEEAAALQRTVVSLKAEIQSATNQESKDKRGSAAAISTLNLIGVLQTEEVNTTLQLESVNSQSAEAKITASGPALGAVPLEFATTAVRSSVARPIEFGALGALAGLVIGLLVALLRARLDGRLRSRDDIARAAGVPVLTSLAVRAPRRAADWGHLLDIWSPTVAESARLSRVLQDLAIVGQSKPRGQRLNEPAGPTANGNTADANVLILGAGVAVTALVFAGDVDAHAVAIEIAAYAAIIGLPVTLVVQPGDRPLRRLSTALEGRKSRVERQRKNLTTQDLNPGMAADSGVLTVNLVAVNPEAPGQVGVARGGGDAATVDSFLVMSAGYARAAQIADAVEIAAREHLRLVGAVVANPDPGDMTTGRLRSDPVPPHQQVTATLGVHR